MESGQAPSEDSPEQLAQKKARKETDKIIKEYQSTKTRLDAAKLLCDELLTAIDQNPKLASFKANQPVLAPLLDAKEAITTVKNTSFRRAVLLATTNAELRKLGGKQMKMFAESLKNFQDALLPAVASFETQCQNMKCKVNLEISFHRGTLFDAA